MASSSLNYGVMGSVSKIPSISDSMAQCFRSPLMKISTNISDTLVVEIPDAPLSGEEAQRLNKEVIREAWNQQMGNTFLFYLLML